MNHCCTPETRIILYITYTSILKIYIDITYGNSFKRPLLATKNTLSPTQLWFHDSTLGWHPPLTSLQWAPEARKGRRGREKWDNSCCHQGWGEHMQGNKNLLQRLIEWQLGNARRFRIQNNIESSWIMPTMLELLEESGDSIIMSYDF